MTNKGYRTLTDDELIEKLKTNNSPASAYYSLHLNDQQKIVTIGMVKQFLEADIKGLGEAGCFELAVCLIRFLIQQQPKKSHSV